MMSQGFSVRILHMIGKLSNFLLYSVKPLICLSVHGSQHTDPYSRTGRNQWHIGCNTHCGVSILAFLHGSLFRSIYCYTFHTFELFLRKMMKSHFIVRLLYSTGRYTFRSTCYSILITVQRYATQSSLFILLQVHSTCFWCQAHPSAGVHKTVTTASGTGSRWREAAAQKNMTSTGCCSYSFVYSW